MRSYRGILPVLLVIAAAILCGAWGFFFNPNATDDDVNTSKPAVSPGHPIQVLFIGNSYTYVNNLPLMLGAVASSDPEGDIAFTIRSVTVGGAHLADHWKAGKALKAIQSQHWDYVVLQDQSEWALFEPDIESARAAGKNFAPEIAKAGAKPVLFETWARNPGTHWYTDKDTGGFMHDPPYMLKQLSMNNNYLARLIKADVVPAGDAWDAALKQDAALGLYQDDASHPSAAGTYLTALLFYRYFEGHGVEKITYKPDGVTDDAAKELRHFVSEYPLAR